MIRHPRVRRVVALASLLSFFTACYVERPVTAATPAPSTRIIAQLTDTGAAAMANTIGPAATAVEGVVAQGDANTWTLRLVRVEQRGGTSTAWNRELVTFPRYALTNAREKRLDKKRSWIVGGIIAAAIVAGTLLFSSGVTGGGGGGEPVPPV